MSELLHEALRSGGLWVLLLVWIGYAIRRVQARRR